MVFSKRKLSLFVIAAAVLATTAGVTPFVTGQASANHVAKILMTKTIESTQDPGQGHQTHQLALILPPNGDWIYTGTLTWSASQPVEVVVLHNYNGNASSPPTIYRLGDKQFALSLMRTGFDGKAANVGTIQFTGNALALHNIEGNQFTATVTVDGIQRIPRSENSVMTEQQSSTTSTSAEPAGSVLKLSSASIPIDIPLSKGYENGNELFFIATDASDQQVADMLTNETGFKVNHAPLLAQTPDAALQQVYVFRNGIAGDGPLGFQLAVTSAKPGDEGYSPLWQINFVDWNQGATASELKSAEEIMSAQQSGDLEVTQTDIIADHPVIKWQGGSLKVREDANNINDDSPYVGGQVVKIDTENMVVSMVAHRGWGPDGKTIYYIVTDTTPEMPGTMMGVPFTPADEALAATPVAVDLFQFMNGIKGSGPMGFQAGIGGANPTDENYSPMWKISFITWKDPAQARILETKADINKMLTDGSITLQPAEGGKHVVNCPFFDQQTVFEHMSK